MYICVEMHLKQKYIRTVEDRIIVFSELLQHSDFARWKPVSAGFISIRATTVDGYPETTCTCYGESVSLRLQADEATDTMLANEQILGNGY